MKTVSLLAALLFTGCYDSLEERVTLVEQVNDEQTTAIAKEADQLASIRAVTARLDENLSSFQRTPDGFIVQPSGGYSGPVHPLQTTAAGPSGQAPPPGQCLPTQPPGGVANPPAPPPTPKELEEEREKLAKAIGDAIGKELSKRLDKIDKDVDAVSQKIDDRFDALLRDLPCVLRDAGFAADRLTEDDRAALKCLAEFAQLTKELNLKQVLCEYINGRKEGKEVNLQELNQALLDFKIWSQQQFTSAAATHQKTLAAWLAKQCRCGKCYAGVSTNQALVNRGWRRCRIFGR